MRNTIGKVVLAAGYILCLYLCMMAAAIIHYIKSGGLENGQIGSDLYRIALNPIRIWQYRSMLMVLLVVLGSVFYMAAIAVSMTRTKNFMAGKEHGVSEWGKPSELTDKFQSERPEKNRILSQNVRIDINDRSTRMNNNIYILGGSGTGKTQFVIAPNLLQHNTSILVTDPSGEILNVYGNDLEAAGYEIRVLNTVDLSKCHGYNPFRYLKNAEDVDQLITMIMANTTAKGQQSSDPFWEKSERMLVKGIMLYVYMEVPYAKRNLVTVIDCLSGIRVVSNKPYYHTGFGSKIRQLPAAHPARILYERVMEGAEDTVRSILITALSRFSMFDNNKELERILSTDEMEMDEFGTGYHGNPERKMALFCITPDNGDKTYNFLVGMLYSQFFSRQYYVGDTFYGNRLPVPIMCWFDELANIALPEGFTDLLSTVRKRNIGIAMIFQDIAKTKKVFKDEWESLIGNADTFIYLGGNEPGSQKYVSERLGQMTLYTRSEGRSYGQHASSSTNVSSLGRPLIYASEIDNMSPEQCIIKLKGQAPIMDYKYKTFQSDAYKKAISFGEYVIRIRKRKPTEIQTSMISSEALEHYRIMGEKDARYRPVVVHPELLFGQKEKSETLDVEDLRAASQAYRQRMAAQEALKVANKAKEKSMLDRVLLLSPDQAEEVRLALEHGLSEEDVQTIFNPSLSAEQMRLIRTMKETSNAQ